MMSKASFTAFSCECGAEYIGETGRNLKPDYRNTKKKSGMKTGVMVWQFMSKPPTIPSNGKKSRFGM